MTQRLSIISHFPHIQLDGSSGALVCRLLRLIASSRSSLRIAGSHFISLWNPCFFNHRYSWCACNSIVSMHLRTRETTMITKRLAVHAFVAILILLASFTTASATEPSPPAALTAKVYSKTAAELFWDLSDVFGLRYEVRRNGTTLSTADGISFFDDTLSAGTTYTYAVVAIDRDGLRSAPSSVTLTTNGAVVPSSRPPAPSGLYAKVYSKTAAELFWDLSDIFGLRHEVRRNGKQLRTSDGISFFDDTLTAGTTYTYTVVAIDHDGLRSAPSSVTLTTAGTASDDDTLETDDLVAPAINRIAIYSGTAAELFWQRSPAGSLVARIEVSRDAVVLGSTEGTSFFDDTRSPGVDYQYSLVAIAADGSRSDGSAADPGSDGTGLDVIRADNVVTLVSAVFDAYRGEPWRKIVTAMANFSRTSYNQLALRPDIEELIACDNGGTVLIRFIYYGFNYDFDNCLDGETLISGEIEAYTYMDDQHTNNIRSTGITVTDQTGTNRFSGHVGSGDVYNYTNGMSDGRWYDVIYTTSDWRGYGGVDTSTKMPAYFERSAADGTHYALTDAIIDFQSGYMSEQGWQDRQLISVSLFGSFALNSDRTGDATLRVETPEKLVRPFQFYPESEQPVEVPDDWTFTEGSLRVVAPDGSGVLLEAANGDESSARLTLIDSSGEQSSFDQVWSVWQENLRFD
ncbi:MAG: hypothetical protein HKN42_04900 [Granulosicoccus sp.]|nr:hypothetical protein [Granulosicoccus sp.]